MRPSLSFSEINLPCSKSSLSLLCTHGHDLKKNPLSQLQTHKLSLAPTQSSPSMAASETSKETILRYAFGNVLSFFILVLIGVLAFSIRLFSVSSLIFKFPHFYSRSNRLRVFPFRNFLFGCCDKEGKGCMELISRPSHIIYVEYYSPNSNIE